MLKEKVAALHQSFMPLRQAYLAIELATPVKRNIEEVCRELKSIIDSGELNTVDEEIKTAITSVYTIFESASKGLQHEAVAALFEPYKH